MKKLLVAFVVAGVVACSDSPTEPEGSTVTAAPRFSAAQPITDNDFVPIDISVFIPCAVGGLGEVADLSGTLHVLTHTTINDNNFRAKLHFQPQKLSGVGQTTGDKYQGTGVTQETFGGSFMNGQFNDTFVNNFRMIGQGPGNNLLVHETFHVTLNANGDLTAVVDNFSVECK